jgi:hypothetical protein
LSSEECGEFVSKQVALLDILSLFERMNKLTFCLMLFKNGTRVLSLITPFFAQMKKRLADDDNNKYCHFYELLENKTIKIRFQF